jgi:acrylyl-CoA reductase (NADPH)
MGDTFDGIDLACTVAESRSPDCHAGDEVVVTGWGLSDTWPGGYTRQQRVRPDMLVRKQATLSLAQSMAIGTAGLTAMQCVLRLEQAGVTPDQGPVIVTGAAGGELPDLAGQILAGQVRGRVVIEIGR